MRSGGGRHRAGSARRFVVALGVGGLGLVAGSGTALTASTGSPAAALDAVVGRVSALRSLPTADLPAPSGLLERPDAVSRSDAQRSPFADDALLAVPTAPAPQGLVDDAAAVLALPPGLTVADVAAGLLAADVPASGAGTFSVVPGSDPGPGTGQVRTIRVEVEDGLAVDGQAFAATVMATLNDPRGWGHDGSLSFARTDGEAELRVMLASPTSVDVLCAPLETEGEVSCGRAGHAVLNLKRWVLATGEYAQDKAAYRQYLVNHEVGHLLGHGHEQCPGAGVVASVMQQQSYKAAPCLPNPWPFP
ncbi:hypothetical protein Cch01nite_00410 [Cellulomonas chitinilytica]|uniref:DUF3152 domain-containing protein n=1 Tax=Cellulomonas chitinilytica TaxID=398759 RepID=A0A919NXH0_9CELL|nr:hypothetical protein Cch01nite_00410 [Cellulomonas chitinilytica]